MSAACIFCKIIKGEIPSMKLFESDKVFAFLDINPLSYGHALVIPKHHGAKLHDIPDDQLTEILPVAKKIAQAVNATDYNILQNNGRIARTFIENLRVKLGVRSSHNLPALAVQEEPPTRFFDLVIRTNDHSVRFRLRMDNLYLIGYQMENGQWLEFNDSGVHLIPEQGTTFLGFSGNYNRLVNVAGLNMEQIRVGFYNLGYGINQLATSTAREIRARYLVVVIMMICESTRLNPIFDYMATKFDNSHGTNSFDYNAENRNRESQIQPWITDLVHVWYPLSAALLRADAFPEEPFELQRNVVRLPPDNREIKTIAQAVGVIGILLGLRFRRGEQ